MSWVSDLPEELKQRPTCLVVLSGFDTTYNAIHKHVLDTFCNNRRADRVPLNFVALPADHEYPKPHGRRTTYEFYLPKGILKRSWMTKHLRHVPALVVMFFDLDWDDPLWKERQMECATRLQIIRTSLQNRSTKIAVVLMQRMPPPPGEDDVASERAISFCSVCDLSPKALFVLPQTDHMLGFILRLENAFYDIVQNYYATEARRVKAHAELLTKSMHQPLFVRHQFKIAFFNELRQDVPTALKHYKQAYSNLLEIAVTKSNATEIKSVAGLINYKICAQSFAQNSPLDAIGQIRRHIDTFRSLEGLPELAFEHSAWMSTQFAAFGDLFDVAIKQGLSALQTQHPGFYYQQAAYHAILRKQRGLGLSCHHGSSPPPLDLDLGSAAYFGQRPLQAVLQRDGIEIVPEGDRDKRLLRQLQDSEHLIDHSQTIISHLEAAIGHFRKFKCARMKTLLTVQMGEERYQAGEFGKALALLRPAALDYRLEKWYRLLTSVLTTALRCAYMTASVKDYVAIAIEMIGKDVVRSAETKKRIQVNLLKVLSGRPPEGESGLGTDHTEQAHELWLGAWSATSGASISPSDGGSGGPLTPLPPQQPSPISCQVAMHYEGGFVECKACFSPAKVVITELLQVSVYLRLCCQFPVAFNKLCISFNNPAYDSHCILTDEPTTTSSSRSLGSISHDEGIAVGDLYLAPDIVKKVSFSFHALREDVGKPIEIKAITLELGSQVLAVLKWTSAALCGPLLPYAEADAAGCAATSSSDGSTVPLPPWHRIQPRIVATVVPREALMDIQTTFDGPCLKDELFNIRYDIVNKENSNISNLRVTVKSSSSVISTDAVHLAFANDALTDKHSPTAEIEKSLPGDLSPGHSSSVTVYMKVTSSGSVVLTSQVTYLYGGAGPAAVACSGESQTQLQVVDAFEISSRVRSCKFADLDGVNVEEPFVLCTNARNISPFELELESTALQQSKYFSHGESAPAIRNMRLGPGDLAAECHYMVGGPAPSTVPLGSYLVTWRRASAEAAAPASEGASVTTVAPSARTRVVLPAVAVQQPPLLVTAVLPSHGVVRQSFLMTYTVHNRTERVQELEAAMESSDVIVYAGNRQTRFRVLPYQSHDIVYSFFPLVTGQLAIPQLQLASTSPTSAAAASAGSLSQTPSVDICRRLVPESIFVMPHPRG